MESSYCVLFSSLCNFAFCFRICYQLCTMGFKPEVDQYICQKMSTEKDLNFTTVFFQTLSNFDEIIVGSQFHEKNLLMAKWGRS